LYLIYIGVQNAIKILLREARRNEGIFYGVTSANNNGG